MTRVICLVYALSARMPPIYVRVFGLDKLKGRDERYDSIFSSI